MTMRARAISEELLVPDGPRRSLSDLVGDCRAADLGRRVGADTPQRRRVVRGSVSRISPQEAAVLAAILEDEDEESYGYEIARRVGAPSASIYKALAVLSRASLVSARTEDPDVAQAAKRPPRTLYMLTANGEHELGRWRAEQLSQSPAARFLA